MMKLGWPSYLIHGTNKPYGVGLRSSHGCVRFYPEDIALLYDQVPIGTKVTVVNQPFVFGWQDDALYVQAFPVLEDDEREHPTAAEALLNAAISDAMWQQVKEHNAVIDLELVNEIVANPRGIAIPVSKSGVTLDGVLMPRVMSRTSCPKAPRGTAASRRFSEPRNSKLLAKLAWRRRKRSPQGRPRRRRSRIRVWVAQRAERFEIGCGL